MLNHNIGSQKDKGIGRGCLFPFCKRSAPYLVANVFVLLEEQLSRIRQKIQF